MSARPSSVFVVDPAHLIRENLDALPPSDLIVQGYARGREDFMRQFKPLVPPDVLLCEDHLGGDYDGIRTVYDAKKAELLHEGVGIILMTSDARPANLLASLDARPDAILLKPFTLAHALHKIRRVTRARRELRPYRELAREARWNELLLAARQALKVGVPYPHQLLQFQLSALSSLGAHDELSSLFRRGHPEVGSAVWFEEAAVRYELERGRPYGAQARLTPLLPTLPLTSSAHELGAAIKFETGDLSGALADLKSAVAKLPTSAPRQRALAVVSMLHDDFFEAQRASAAALRAHAQVYGISPEDALCAIRAALLNGEVRTARMLLDMAKKELQQAGVLVPTEQLVRSYVARQRVSLNIAQRLMKQALAAAAELPQQLIELEFALVEGSIQAQLLAEACAHAHHVLATQSSTMNAYQRAWAQRLLLMATYEDSVNLPPGLRPPYVN